MTLIIGGAIIVGTVIGGLVLFVRLGRIGRDIASEGKSSGER